MLQLLLDEHIPPDVVDGVRRIQSTASVIALRHWRQGSYLGRGDAEILAAAYASQLTLVTYDVRTIPPLLRTWAESGINHGGVIYIDRRTISQSDVGRIAIALSAVIARDSGSDWTNQTRFLEK
jgi:hypothetical protein